MSSFGRRDGRLHVTGPLTALTALWLLSAGMLAWVLRASRDPLRLRVRMPARAHVALPAIAHRGGDPPAPDRLEPPAEPPRLLSGAQRVALLLVVALLTYGLRVDTVLTITIVNALVMGFFAAANVMKLALIRWSLRHPSAVLARAADAVRIADRDLPVYTILLPVYREAAILPQLVRGITALDYPVDRLDVKLLLEEHDLDTRAAAEQLTLPACFEVLVVRDVGPVGKSRACNHGLEQARGEFLVIYDAEDCPEPDQLRRSVAAFRSVPPEVVCLQAKLNYFNRDHNLLTRWFTAEYSVWFDQLLPGLAHLGVAIPLGGTSNHFVTERLRALNGWSAYNVTEDADLGVRIFLRGWQTAILDSTTFEEATSRYGNWLRQRSRWVKGYMQTYLTYTQHPVRVRRQMGWKAFTAFNLFFGASTVCLLINPIYIALVAVWYATHAAWLQSIFPAAVLYVGTIGLFVGNAACVVSTVSGCYARRNYADVKWALLAPAYWLLMSLAAFKALLQLLRKPWYWEKTDHGFFSLTEHAIALPLARSEELAPAPLAPPPRAAPRASVAAVAHALPAGSRRARAVAWATSHEVTIVVAVAVLVAAAATLWSALTHSMVLYGDAAAHLDVARRVTDGLRVGFAQLGSVWLPLPHLLLVPLVAVGALWHTGLAGALVSGVCFAYSATRIYTLVRELSGSRLGAWCAFAVFAFNLNLLYVQSTALTEPVLLAFCVGAAYHLAVWMRTFWMGELIWAAALTTCATLSRYEGWALLAAALVTIFAWGRFADRRRSSAQANALLFAVVGAQGVALWFLYNLIIFGDPLYFLHSIYSAQAINGGQAHYGLLATKGQIGTTLLTFGWDLVGTVGPLALLAGALALAFLARSGDRRRRTLVVLALLAAPVLFDVISLYAGQITIRVTQVAPHQLWNVRYGLIAIPLCAVAIGCAAARARALAVIAAAVVVASAGLMFASGPVTLRDGRSGVSHTSAGNPPLAALYLRAHYRGGHILADDGSASSLIFESDLDLSGFITPGDHPFWERALAAPSEHAAWLVAYPGDAVWSDMASAPQRFTAYRLVASSGRARLFHRTSTAAAISEHK